MGVPIDAEAIAAKGRDRTLRNSQSTTPLELEGSNCETSSAVIHLDVHEVFKNDKEERCQVDRLVVD